MGLLQPAVSTTAYLKMGLLGLSAGGKTFTAGLIARGLYKYIQARGAAPGPVAFFDTETGSDWLIPHFEKDGVPFLSIKRRRFADLLQVMDEAEGTASVLIIDSVTHPWRELCESHMKKKERTFLQISDYQYLNGPYGWGAFNQRFINSKLHIIMCGRGGDIYDEWTDEDGKRHLDKVGTKMKTQTETAFEPSLLVLMQQIEDMRTHVLTHRGVVQKDRSTLLDGKSFDNPTFECFLPHIEKLNIGGSHVGIQNAGDSQSILKTEKRDWQPAWRKVVLAEIEALLVEYIPGLGAADKSRKVQLIKKHFGGMVWQYLEDMMALPELREGYDTLHRELAGVPSRYSAAPSPPLAAGAGGVAGSAVEIGDRLPDHSAPPAVVVEAVTMTAETGTMIDLRDPIPLGEAAAAVVAKAKRTRKAITLAAEDAARSAPEVEAIPPFLRRGNGILGSDESWGTD